MREEKNIKKHAFWQGPLFSWGLAFTAGLLANLAHAPLFLWPFMLLSLAVLFWLVDATKCQHNGKAGFIRAWWFAFGYFSLGFSWLAHAFVARGAGFDHLGWPAVLALCAGLALFWGVAGFVYTRFAPRGWTRIFLFAALFFLVEYARGHLLTGFPWGLPGYIWKSGGAVSQLASLIGVYGLTFFIFLAGASLSLVLTQRGWQQRFLALALAILPLTGAFLWGHERLNRAVVNIENAAKLRLVGVAVNQSTKWTPEGREDLLNRYLALSLSIGIEDIDYVVWSESALPSLLLEDEEILGALDQAFADGPGLVLGSVRREPTDTGHLRYYNTLLALRFKKGEQPLVEAVYDKKHLVPFGEYVPFSSILERLGINTLSILGEPFSSGQGPYLLNLTGAPAASPRICYEIIFPGFAHKARPRWILNISNDSWYGSGRGPQQHANQVGYRALEVGTPVARSASSGITGLVDPYGRWVVQTPSLLEDAFVDAALPAPLASVFYARWGDLPIFIVLGFLGLVGLVCLLRPSTLRGS